MATSTLAADVRSELTDLCRSFSLPISVTTYWRVQLRFNSRKPAEDSGSEFETIEAAHNFIGSLGLDSNRQARVIGPFDRVTIELGTAGKVGA